MKRDETYQKILDACDPLFSERGYAAVTLQDIGAAVNMRHASLYYYAPKGKEQLYVAVMERNFKRHGEGLTNAVIAAGDDVRAQLHGIATWFASQPPMDLGRIVRSDMLDLESSTRERLIALSLDTLRVPIAAVIRNAARKGLFEGIEADFAAMGLVGLLQSVHNVPSHFLPTQQALTDAAISCADMLLYGWMKR